MGQLLDLGWDSYFSAFSQVLNEICWTKWLHEPASCDEYCFMHIFIFGYVVGVYHGGFSFKYVVLEHGNSY